MDRIAKNQRSALMGRIRSKDTAPEKLVRRLLHRLGFRFRLHDSALPGSPDIILGRHRTVVFVHGCFWHQHPRCRRAFMPKSRPEYWKPKLAGNVERFRVVRRQLRRLGWRVLVVWECEVRDLFTLRNTLSGLLRIGSENA